MKLQHVQMINLKKETKQGECSMWSPVAYFKDSMTREHFVMEILFLRDFPFHSIFKMLFSYFSWHSHSTAFSSKRPDNCWRKRKDDRNHYRILVLQNHVTLGSKCYLYAMCDPHSSKLLCITFVCFEPKRSILINLRFSCSFLLSIDYLWNCLKASLSQEYI